MLGTMLLRAGLLSEGQVMSARAFSTDHHVSFLQATLALRLSDEDALVAFLSSNLMIPRVRPLLLLRVGQPTLALIPPDLAQQYTLLPISIDAGRNLTVAMADPTDMRAVEAVATQTGAYLIRAVAALTPLREAIDRHYDAKQTTTTLGAGQIVSQRELERTMARYAATSAATPGKMLSASSTSRSSYAQRDAPSNLDGRSKTGVPPRRNPALTPHDREASPLSPETFTRMLLRLTAATDKDAVTRALLDFLGTAFDRVILFVNSRGELRGHDARGADLMAEAVRQVRIPSEEGSIFRVTIQEKRAFFGPMPSDHRIDIAFAQALGGLEGNVLCLPITLGDKVPLVLFAHGTTHAIDPHLIAELSKSISAAFRRIIAARRSRDR